MSLKDCKKFCQYFVPFKDIVNAKYMDPYYLDDYIKCYNYCNKDKMKMKINKEVNLIEQSDSINQIIRKTRI